MQFKILEKYLQFELHYQEVKIALFKHPKG